jgi:ADP-heptose:LPS heptosyltransferase
LRSLSLNSNGVIGPHKSQLQTGAPIKALHNPSQALRRIERVRGGNKLRILISRTAGGIGDVLMTLPTVKQIRKQYDCLLDYQTDFEYLDGALPKVLRGNPHIDRVLDYRMVTEEEKEQYDAIVELTCPCTVHEQPHAEPINRIDLFARHAGVRLEDTSIDYFLTADELAWAQEWIASLGFSRNKLFLVQAHSSTSRRDLPIPKLQHAIGNILKADPSFRGIIVTHTTDSTKQNWNIYGTGIMKDMDVRQIAAVMFYCDVVLCQDSAILHLAGALEKKIITFFGPTDPRARVNYFPRAVAICPGQHLHCFPCWYSPSCNSTYPCWKRVEEQLIIDVTVATLQNKPLPASADLVYFGNSQVRKPGLGELL